MIPGIFLIILGLMTIFSVLAMGETAKSSRPGEVDVLLILDVIRAFTCMLGFTIHASLMIFGEIPC